MAALGHRKIPSAAYKVVEKPDLRPGVTNGDGKVWSLRGAVANEVGQRSTESGPEGLWNCYSWLEQHLVYLAAVNIVDGVLCELHVVRKCWPSCVTQVERAPQVGGD